MYKKINAALLSFLSLLFISACDKIPDGVVENSIADYQVVQVIAPTSLVYPLSDSTVVTSLKIENPASVTEIWCSVGLLDGTKTIKEKVEMTDDGNQQGSGDATEGDGIFSGKFVMSRLYAVGEYEIRYYIKDKIHNESENTALVAVQKFIFSKNENNVAPVLSDLSLPESVSRGASFVFTVKASDQNGLSDISEVYFKLYRPDGSLVDPGNGLDYFLMHDDGNVDVYGDAQSGDGIFSFKNSFGSTSAAGSWRFEFQARDRSGAVSNSISKTMTVN